LLATAFGISVNERIGNWSRRPACNHPNRVPATTGKVEKRNSTLWSVDNFVGTKPDEDNLRRYRRQRLWSQRRRCAHAGRTTAALAQAIKDQMEKTGSPR
jgi:hypothetical protein